MIFISFGGGFGPGGGFMFNNNFPFRDRRLNIALMVGIYVVPMLLQMFNGFLGGGNSTYYYSPYTNAYGNTVYYHSARRTTTQQSLMTDFINGVIPIVLGFSLLGVLAGRFEGLTWPQALLGYLRNPFGFITRNFNGNQAGWAGAVPVGGAARPVYTREEVAAAVQRLPTELFASESGLKSMHIGELRERCTKAGISTEGILEKEELVARIKEAGGTSGTSCSICFDDYEEGDCLRVLPCKHRYHLSCIDRWAFTASEQGRGPTCPVCNLNILDSHSQQGHAHAHAHTATNGGAGMYNAHAHTD